MLLTMVNHIIFNSELLCSPLCRHLIGVYRSPQFLYSPCRTLHCTSPLVFDLMPKVDRVTSSGTDIWKLLPQDMSLMTISILNFKKEANEEKLKLTDYSKSVLYCHTFQLVEDSCVDILKYHCRHV